MRQLPLWAALAVALLAAPAAQAIWPFGESEEEKAADLATHVAETLREPNRTIAQAQDATEAGDTEEAIRLFRKAQSQIEAVEAAEDTSGSAWSALRLKKFQCISALDALALKRAEVMDVRQAVTDTGDLEARLAAERAELAKEKAAEEAEAKQLESPKAPTFAEQLPAAEKALAQAQAEAKAASEAAQAAAKAHGEAAEALAEASRANAKADADLMVAGQALAKAEANAPAQEGAADPAAPERAARDKAKADAQAAQAKVAAARQALDAASAKRQAAEAKARQAADREADARLAVETLRKAIAQEQAKAKADAEAAKRKLEAEELLRRQEQAQAEAKARAEREAKALKDAQAKADAEADAKARQGALARCEALWRQKEIVGLERDLAEHAAKWPDEPGFMLLLARLRLLQGRPDDALELVAMIPGQGPRGLDAQLVAAGAYLTKNRPEEAMRILERAAQTHPDDPRPYFDTAIVFLRLPQADPEREIAARYYARSVALGGKRSLALERRLNME